METSDSILWKGKDLVYEIFLDLRTFSNCIILHLSRCCETCTGVIFIVPQQCSTPTTIQNFKTEGKDDESCSLICFFARCKILILCLCMSSTCYHPGREQFRRRNYCNYSSFHDEYPRRPNPVNPVTFTAWRFCISRTLVMLYPV